MNKENKGYIALVSVIILGGILLAVVASVSLLSYHRGATEIDYQSKQLSFFLAYSCLDHALLQLASDKSYSGNETHYIGSFECSVGQIVVKKGGVASSIMIPTSATLDGAKTGLSVYVDYTTLSTISLQET